MQAQKAMYSLVKKSQLLLPIDIMFQLFEHTVAPIFFNTIMFVKYGGGYENCDIIEKTSLRIM